jgi:hypothetical protein
MSADAMIKQGKARSRRAVLVCCGAVLGLLLLLAYTNWDTISNVVMGARDAMKEAAGIRVDMQSNAALIEARKAVAEAKTIKEQIFAYQKLDKATTAANKAIDDRALGAGLWRMNTFFGEKVRDWTGLSWLEKKVGLSSHPPIVPNHPRRNLRPI